MSLINNVSPSLSVSNNASVKGLKLGMNFFSHNFNLVFKEEDENEIWVWVEKSRVSVLGFKNREGRRGEREERVEREERELKDRKIWRVESET